MIEFTVAGLMTKAINTAKQQTPINITTKSVVVLEDIPLELVFEFNEDLSSDVPTITLDDGSNISDNISNNSANFSLRVQAVGKNHRATYEKVLNLRKKRQRVSLYVDKLYTNLAISNISRTTTSLNSTEFTIAFTQIEYAYLQMIPSPSPASKPITNQKTEVKTGKQDWEGDLASDAIKLPGEK